MHWAVLRQVLGEAPVPSAFMLKPRRLVVALGLAGGLLAADARAAPDAASLARGEQVYARCAACHAIEGNRTGPQHCGLFGRRAGTAPGYNAYSKAMRESHWVWDEKSLNVFLKDPMTALQEPPWAMPA